MKKSISILILFCAFAIGTQAQGVNYPFGSAGYTQSDADSLTLDIDVNNLVEFVEIDSTTLDTILTVNCADVSGLKRGSELYVIATADDTDRVITWGTNLTGTAETVTALKTDIFHFIFDGSTYRLTSANQTD